jgi:hypothetical protein
MPHRAETPHGEAAPEHSMAMGIFASTQQRVISAARTSSS